MSGDEEKRWAGSLSPEERRHYAMVSLDEIEVTRDAMAGMAAPTQATLKEAKRWVSKHRRLLKLLGHRKKIRCPFPKAKKE